MTPAELTTIVRRLSRRSPSIKLVYLFGSRASGTHKPTSDFDLAVYIHHRNRDNRVRTARELQAKLMKILGTDDVDLVVLNDTRSSVLKHQIVSTGRRLYSVEPFDLTVEHQIRQEHSDYVDMMERAGLS